MNLEIATLFLVVLGFFPWHISRNRVTVRKEPPRAQVLWQCEAIFWQLTVRCPDRGQTTWKLTVPLILRLSTAIWAMVKNLISKE